jgi:hypothetical protein
MLALLRSTSQKLSLPSPVLLDASLHLRRYYIANAANQNQGLQVLSLQERVCVMSACLYLAGKVNEEEGRVRLRDYLNVSFYACKEALYHD